MKDRFKLWSIIRVLTINTRRKLKNTTHSLFEKEEKTKLISFFEGNLKFLIRTNFRSFLFCRKLKRRLLAFCLDYDREECEHGKKDSTNNRQIKKKFLKTTASVVE